MAEPLIPDALLNLWFADTRENPANIPARNTWWFQADSERDHMLMERFGDACRDARSGKLSELEASPRGRLALVLLLDQLPRNLFRGTAQAFASDAQALDLALEAHDLGMDQSLHLIERTFLWMPLQHSEDLEVQQRSVRWFGSLAEEDPQHEAIWNGFTNFARLHRDIIEQFGRFPHRNVTLGRQSTPSELAYLQNEGQTFGQ